MRSLNYVASGLYTTKYVKNDAFILGTPYH